MSTITNVFDITNTGTWASEQTAPGMILYTALDTQRQLVTNGANTVAGVDHTKGEVNALTRSICFMIDPVAYNGAAYGLLRGNRVWGKLWTHVSEIVGRHAQNPGPGLSMYNARWYAALDLGRLTREWPAERDTMLQKLKDTK